MFIHSIKVFLTVTVFNVLAEYQGVALQQCSIFLHSIKVLHWNSVQYSCTVAKFCTGTVFNILAQYVLVLYFHTGMVFNVPAQYQSFFSLEQCLMNVWH